VLLCLLSTIKLVCGGRSGTIWLPSHHPGGGCCTLVVFEEIPPLPYVKHFEVPEKLSLSLLSCTNLKIFFYYLFIYSFLFVMLYPKLHFCMFGVWKKALMFSWNDVQSD